MFSFFPPLALYTLFMTNGAFSGVKAKPRAGKGYTWTCQTAKVVAKTHSHRDCPSWRILETGMLSIPTNDAWLYFLSGIHFSTLAAGLSCFISLF